MELDWLIYFPKYGNKGKYIDYNVRFTEHNNKSVKPEKHVTLRDILENPKFDRCYPHTVGYFKDASRKGKRFKPEYLEIRRIHTIEDFWLFLNALDL
jgi:hypothetical protein